MSFGSPLGLQGMATVGYIARKPEKHLKYIMFHTAFINPGNSGGPLVNMKGQLVGVNHGIATINMFQVAQGLNIAIPVHSVRSFLYE